MGGVTVVGTIGSAGFVYRHTMQGANATGPFFSLVVRSPRIPLEGVNMAKHQMHYGCSNTIRELGLPQTPPEVTLEKAVRWFRSHGYA